MMKFNGREFAFEEWPSLPVPLSNMTGALIDGKIYIAGGIEDAVQPSSTSHFFVFDTDNKIKRLGFSVFMARYRQGLMLSQPVRATVLTDVFTCSAVGISVRVKLGRFSLTDMFIIPD